MDRLKLTHALVCDFLRKQFGPKVAKLVYKDDCSAYSPTVDDERMDLESVVKYGLSSIGKKRKLPSDNSTILTKKAKVGGAHASLADESSGSESDTESSEEETAEKKTTVVPSADLRKPLNAKKASESSTSSSDEDSDALPNGKVVRAPEKFPGPSAAARKPIKKATSDSGSSSECEETLSKSVPTPMVGKSTVHAQAKSVAKQAPAKTTLVLTPRSVTIKKKAVSSSSDTESSDSKDEPTKTAKPAAQVTFTAAQTAEKCSSSSSSSSSTDSGPPMKNTPVVKGGNVSNLKGKRSVNEVVKVKREVSSSSSSDSGPPVKNIGPAKSSKVAPKQQVAKPKTAPPSDSSSDEDSSDEEPLKKGKTIAAVKPTAAAVVKKKDSSSSATSDSDDDATVLDLAKTRVLLKAGLENADISSSSASSSTEGEQLSRKPSVVGLQGTVGLAKGTPTKTVAQVDKKKQSSSSSSESSSEEDALPAKLVADKKRPTVSNVQPTVVEPALQKGVRAGQSKRNSLPATVTPKAKPISSPSESSSDENDKTEMANTGKNAAPAAVKVAVSEDSSSSSDTDSEEEEEEETITNMQVGKAKAPVVGKGSAARGRINALAKRNDSSSSSSGEDTEMEVKKSGAEVNGLSNTVIGKAAQDNSSSSTSSSDDEGKKSAPPVAKKQVAKGAGNDRKSKETKGNHVSSQAKKSGEPFRRFPITKEELNPQFRDNSFQSKNDKWGERAYADLSSVKGKNFRKEKTKKKRGSYSGGRIDPNVVGAVKFNFDD